MARSTGRRPACSRASWPSAAWAITTNWSCLVRKENSVSRISIESSAVRTLILGLSFSDTEPLLVPNEFAAGLLGDHAPTEQGFRPGETGYQLYQLLEKEPPDCLRLHASSYPQLWFSRESKFNRSGVPLARRIRTVTLAEPTMRKTAFRGLKAIRAGAPCGGSHGKNRRLPC